MTLGLRDVLCFGALFPLLAGLGCSVSTSFSTSSDSISGLVTSFSDSSASSSEGEASAFLGDLSALVSVWVETAPPDAALLAAAGDVAARHGVSDWEGRPATYRTLGEGFRMGGLGEEAVRKFAREVLGGDARITTLVLEGYGA